MAAKLSDKKAATMTEASTAQLLSIPQPLRETLRVDNGKEFSQFKELEQRTGLSVYFADAYSAWERGI